MAMRRLIRDRRGGVAIMAASVGGLLCALAALVIDVGSVALYARKLQGAADLAALAATRDLDRYDAAARATAAANVGPSVQVAATTGVYVADATLEPGDRFRSGAGPANAARVTLSGQAPLYFGRWLLGRETVAVHRSGTAATSAGEHLAMFSIGSRLARLDGGLANALLSGLTGSTVSLTALDYNALATADVSLLDFTDALSIDLGLTVGDYEALKRAEIDAGRALGVLDAVAGDADGSALSKLARAADGLRVKVGDLIGLEADAPQALRQGLEARVSALDLATAMLETGGDRQLALNLGAQAGLADLSLDLAIGERPNGSPWIAVTDTGQPIIRTAQARLYLEARTSQKLAGLAQVSLPILIELAPSEARLESLACDPRRVDLAVRPGVARAAIGTVDESRLGDFKRALTVSPAVFVSVAGLVTVSGSSQIEAADQGFRPVRFSAQEIEDQAIRTVGSRGFVGGLVASLVGRLDITVRVVGLGLGLGDLAGALKALLTPLSPMLDGVVNALLDTLGLKFGEADVRVLGLSCPDAHGPVAPVLVG
ncbi:MAG: hypothetical protein KF910_10350 [Brevundimonas sp.]|uniref:TadG family pilus assembly protein n=1 Tax=Brevundimonas sp. TaxID=1871086 RepID=UPI0025BFDC7D|nr:pilus assembly protein TadG-related protein [Brevundimonas sp.]MBX3478000.1 hypothetical protein [Brevundimonas sp.]